MSVCLVSDLLSWAERLVATWSGCAYFILRVVDGDDVQHRGGDNNEVTPYKHSHNIRLATQATCPAEESGTVCYSRVLHVADAQRQTSRRRRTMPSLAGYVLSSSVIILSDVR